MALHSNFPILFRPISMCLFRASIHGENLLLNAPLLFSILVKKAFAKLKAAFQVRLSTSEVMLGEESISTKPPPLLGANAIGVMS